jgi:hypothetical protein
MSSFLHLSGFAAAALGLVALANSVAQEASSVWTCQDVGAPQPEPVGDHKAIQSLLDFLAAASPEARWTAASRRARTSGRMTDRNLTVSPPKA